MTEQPDSISFELTAEHAEALRVLSGGRKTRLTGEVRDGKFVLDAFSFANEEFSRPVFVPVNAPFAVALGK